MNDAKVSLVSISNLSSRAFEDELYDSMLRKEFYAWMNDHGYNSSELANVIENKGEQSSLEQCKFNNILIEAKKETKIDIYQMILYLEEDFIRLNKIIGILDCKVKSIVKRELSEKYSIKIDENNLFRILS